MALPGSPNARDLITLSLKEAGITGVGQPASAEDSNDALTRLNWMIAQWRQKRWMVFRLNTIGFTSTGVLSYTVGPGGNYDTGVNPRPPRVESAFLRQTVPSFPNQLDYPLEILTSREDYNRLPLKALNSFPQYIWYDNAFPLGNLFPWPVPEASLYSVFISFMDALLEVNSLNDVLVLPAEYFAALNTNLAVILRDAYDLPPKQVLIARARDALNVIKGANTQIARLTMPDGVTRRGVYNIFTDQFR